MNESLRNRPHCKKRAVTSQSNIVDTSSSQLPPQPLILKDTTPDDNDNRKMLKKKNEPTSALRADVRRKGMKKE